ncbi:Ger(x)C family spore germination C-terminal domain-containing protein, partial [Neobacillus vireti]
SKEKGKIKVTLLLANPEVGSMQGGGGSTEKPREIITFDANDFIVAKATANAVISRDISYELLSVFVVSEEFAKDPVFAQTFTDVLKDKEIRLSSYLAVSKEHAYEFFKRNRPKMETRPHKYFQFMISHGIENGFIPDSTLFRYFQTTERGTDLFLAMYTTTKRQKHPKIKNDDQYLAGELNVTGELDDTQFIGSAVFKNGVMTAKLTGQETRIVNILDDTTNIKDILVNIPNPFSDNKKQMAARILKTENNKIKMNLIKDRPKIYFTIPLQFEIMSNPSAVDFSDKKNREILKKQLHQHLKSITEKFLKKTQIELKGAPYPLPMYARKYFTNMPEFQKYNFPKAYLNADIYVRPKIEIIDYGKKVIKPVKVGE